MLESARTLAMQLRRHVYSTRKSVLCVIASFILAGKCDEQQFICFDCLCMLVYWNRERGRNQYRLAIGVSHQIGCIMYTASCCAITEMFEGYHGLGGTSEEKEETL